MIEHRRNRVATHLVERIAAGTAYIIVLCGLGVAFYALVFQESIPLSVGWYLLPTAAMLAVAWKRSPYTAQHLQQALLLHIVGLLSNLLPKAMRLLLGEAWFQEAAIKRTVDGWANVKTETLGITPAWALLALLMMIIGIFLFVSLTEGMVRGYAGERFTTPLLGRLVGGKRA